AQSARTRTNCQALRLFDIGTGQAIEKCIPARFHRRKTLALASPPPVPISRAAARGPGHRAPTSAASGSFSIERGHPDMRILRIAALALAASLGACGGSSDQPTKLWEVTGFQNPESALPDTAAGVIYVSNVAGGPGDRD